VTRRRKRQCRGCLDAPVRRVMWAQYCTPCWNRKGRPTKDCTVCGETFAADVMNGRRCRPCVSKQAHAKRVQLVYGLTATEYHELLEYQDGRCYVCHRRPASKRLAVDHDHGTGAVRGLLCKACNRDILGHLGDSVEALHRAIEYLTNPPAKQLWPGRDVTPNQET
jgi:hypothetical protein